MHKINRNPTPRQLRVFALGMIVFAVLMGYLSITKWGIGHAFSVFWAGGAILGALGLAIPRLTRPVFVTAMLLTYPIEWLSSRIILTVLFYGVLTPTGLLMRCLGYDPLQRKMLPASSTYWIAHQSAKDRKQYFRQF
ncbi:MAG: SxtJ family membrane protein [Opitutaceae bacterium]